MSSVAPSKGLYKPIDSSKYEIRLLQIPFSMLRNLGQEDPKPLSAKLIHYSLPLAATSLSTKFVKAVTRKHYTALSYVWGDPTLSEEIIIDGHHVPITHSLYTALRQFQSDAFGEEEIWVDAVCINQDDHEEKSAQIRNMREVYHNAGSVRVWLGPTTGENDEIYRTMQYIQTLTNDYLPDKYPEGHEWWETNLLPLALRPIGLTAQTALSGWHKINMFRETFKGVSDQEESVWQPLRRKDEEKYFQEYLDFRPKQKHLEKFMKLVPNGDLNIVVQSIEKYMITDPEWFSRIWVVQEVGVAGEGIDVCRGPYNLSWDSLINVIFYLHFTCNVKFPSIVKVLSLEATRLGFGEGKRRPLRELMYECRFRKATNPRDKIYGLFGLMKDHITEFLKPDYSKSVEEVFTHATLHFVQEAHSLNPICGQQRKGARTTLPSWVPDYELDLQDTPEALLALDGEDILFHASGHDQRSTYKLPDPTLSMIEWSILPTQGVSIGRVALVSDNSEDGDHFGAIQKRWRKLIDLILQEAPSKTPRELRSLLDDLESWMDESSNIYTTTAFKGEKLALARTNTDSSDLSTDSLSTSSSTSTLLQDDFFDTDNPFFLSYLNVLQTGRSHPSQRTTTPYLPQIPDDLHPPRMTSTKTSKNTSSTSTWSTISSSTASLAPLPSKPTSKTPSLDKALHKAFGSSRTSSKKQPASLATSTIDAVSSSSTITDTSQTHEGAFPPHPTQNSDLSATQKDFLTQLQHLQDSMRRKRFFVTTEGSLGSGVEEVRKGDEVVVLFGCSVPVVLRRVGGETEISKESMFKGDDDDVKNIAEEEEMGREKRWKFIGEAFVDGFMDGEALAWLVKGRWKEGVQDFVLV